MFIEAHSLHEGQRKLPSGGGHISTNTVGLAYELETREGH